MSQNRYKRIKPLLMIEGNIFKQNKMSHIGIVDSIAIPGKKASRIRDANPGRVIQTTAQTAPSTLELLW